MLCDKRYKICNAIIEDQKVSFLNVVWEHNSTGLLTPCRHSTFKHAFLKSRHSGMMTPQFYKNNVTFWVPKRRIRNAFSSKVNNYTKVSVIVFNRIGDETF